MKELRELEAARSLLPATGFQAIHRLLGWPETIQGEVVDSGGVLLLQLDSDEHAPGWMWGDGGRIYYWIRRNDLRDRHFEKAQLVLQCY